MPDSTENVIHGFTSTRIPIRPALAPDQSKLISLKNQNYIDSILENEEFKQTLKDSEAKLKELRDQSANGDP